MKSRMRIENPDDVEVSLTITMTAKKWCELRDQLPNGQWPSVQLSIAISDLLSQVRKILWRDDASDT